MQLMTYVVPTFEQLKKEGEAGRRKITRTPATARWAGDFPVDGHCLALEGQAGLVIDPGMASA
jgi:preprotein translocase subunit SecY